jgi:hypothetical protein
MAGARSQDFENMAVSGNVSRLGMEKKKGC